MPLNERLEILSSIEFVDYVIPFDDDTVDTLLKELKPHVHAKGTDYTKDTVPEADGKNAPGLKAVRCLYRDVYLSSVLQISAK